jgi:gliding motility-associated-like protein
MKKILLCFAILSLPFVSTLDAHPNAFHRLFALPFGARPNPTPPIAALPPYTDADLCPFINAGPDQSNCAAGCVTLTADFAEINNTSNYQIQDIAYAPYPFNSPTATNVIVDLDDIWSGVVNMPFSFCFYGSVYNQLVIGANGVITFNTNYANTYCVWPINNGLPSPTMSGNPFTNVICAPFHDIDPSVGFDPNRIRWHLEGSAPCRKMVITWRNVPMYSGACNSQLATQQIVLHETSNAIDTYIQNKPICGSWNGGQAIHGIQNAAGTVARIVPGRNNNSQWSTSNEGKRFIPTGTPAYAITWTANGATVGNGASINVCPTQTTNYIAQITYTKCNGNTLTVSDTVRVNVAGLANAAINGNTTICNGQATTLTATGGGTYQWSTGSAATSISVNSANTYTVTVTGANGCTATATTIVTVAANLSPSISGTTAICQGTNTILSANAGFSTYSWSNGMNGQSISVGGAGTYTVTVSSASGCTGTASVSVSVNPNPSPSISGTPTFCQGSSTTITASNGFNSYTWSNGGNSQSISVSNTGTYTVTVSNAAGCTGTAQYSVTANPLPSPSISGNNAICAGANTTLVATGGGTYLWSSGQATNSIDVSPNSNTVYIVTVTSPQGCTATAQTTVTVNAPPAASASGGGNVCSGGIISLTASGGGTYVWQGAGITPATANQQNPAIPNAVAGMSGTYTVTVTSPEGCTATAQVSVNVSDCACPNPPTVSTSGGGQICAATSFDITATIGGGATTVTWTSSGSGTFSNGGTGTTVSYTPAANETGSITITATTDDPDGAGLLCSPATTTLTLVINPIPQPNASNDGPVCNDGTANLNASGGTSYLWSGNGIDATNESLQNPTINNIATNATYIVTVTNNGCTATASTTVNVLPPPSPSITGDTELCQGESTTLTANGGVSYLWSNGATTTTIDTDISGNYGVTVTDASGCTATTETTLQINPLPTPSIDGPDQVCEGETATFAVSGFATYSWSNSANTASIDITASGTYTVTVTDAIGCSGTASKTLVINPNPPTTIIGDTQLCDGEQSTLDAGAGYIAYNWSNGAQTQLATVNTTDTYTVTVTSNGGCTQTASIQVVVNPPLTPSIDGPTGICEGASANLTIVGGNFTQYQWSDGSNTASINTSVGGTYIVTVTNAAGCSATTETNLVINPIPIIVIEGATGFCAGGFSQLTATPSGYAQYSWSNFEISQVINAFVGGDYSVTVTDQFGCTNNTQVSVAEIVLIPTIEGSTLLCNGNDTDLSVAAGFSSYEWSTGSNSNTINVNEPDMYAVTVTDALGCTGSANVNVDVVPTLPATVTAEPYLCANDTAYIDLVQEYTSYLWNTGDTIQNITSTIPGTYTVTVSDDNGCTGEGAVTIEGVVLTPVITGNTTFCISTTLSATGGAFTNYLWSTGAVSPSITTNFTGTYTVTVTNINLCTATASISVTQNANLSPSITGNTAFCDGQNSVLSTTTPFNTYAWSNAVNTPTTTVSNTGTYTVTVTDSQGCVGTATYSVTENPNPTPIITGDNSICPNETSTLSTTQSYTSYAWSSGDNTQSINVGGGTYTVTVTNQNGCTGTTIFTVVANTPPTPNIIGDNTICYNETSNLSTTQSYAAYSWSFNNSNSASITVGGGTYSITVTDNNGCTGTDDYVVTQNPAPQPTINGSTTFCANGSSVLSGGNFASYSWSTGENTANITVTNGGTYTLTVTDSNACTATATVVITVTNQLSPSIVGTPNICTGNTTIIDAGIFPNYTWSNGANTATITVGAGTYSVTVSDAGGCSGTDSFTVVENPNPTPNITGDDAICAGQSSMLNAGNYSNYTWSNTATTATINVGGGTYTVTVTDNNGCTGIDTFVVTENPNPTPNITGDDAVCAGQNSTLSAGNYSSYTWSNGLGSNATATVTQSNTYTVTVTDTNACTGTDSFTFTANPNPTPTIGGDDAICAGQISVLSLNGFATYSWSSGENSASINAIGGTYTVTVTDNNGCTGTDTFVVTQNNNPIPTITGDDAICAGQSSTLNAGSYSSYVWNNVANSATINVGGGTYSVTVTDSNGCTGTDSFVVTENPNPTPTITGDDAVCAGQNSVLDAGAYNAYTWSNGLGSNATVIVTQSNTYTVTVTDTNGCTGTDNFVFTANPNPLPTIDGASVICVGESSTLSAGNYSSYTWSNAMNTPTISVSVAGSYSVTVTDANGCTGTDDFAVTVNAPPIATVITCTETTYTSVTFSWNAVAGVTEYLVSINNEPAQTIAGTTTIVDGLSQGQTVTISVVAIGTNDCGNSPEATQTCTTDVFVCPEASFTINNLDDTYCIDFGTVNLDFVPNGGTFSIDGSEIVGSSFDTNEQGVGEHTILYEYINPANGCFYDTMVVVNIVPLPAPLFTLPEGVCIAEPFAPTYTGSSVVEYTWDFGEAGSQNVAQPTPISYTTNGTKVINLEVVDVNGCENNVSNTLIVSSATANITANPDSVLFGNAALLQAIGTSSSGGSVNYVWSVSDSTCANVTCSNISVSPTNETLYTVTVTDSFGCTATAQQAIGVYYENLVIIPSAFSPNGDSQNDQFQIFGRNISEVELAIYDRWGQKMYEGQGNSTLNWDGTYKGKVMEINVFVYYATVTFIDGKREFFKGNVTLVR